MNSNKSYRIRTNIGEDVKRLDVNINQTFDSFEVLSLKLDQVNDYTNNDSNFGVIVGRVLANKGIGIPNAKVSVFIKSDGDDFIYSYKSPYDRDDNNVKYNLLQRHKINDCHISVGSMSRKESVLDSDIEIELFDKYYKYTTRTNNSGDYMIYGVPTGTQSVHVDVDLSDIGFLTQRPIDFLANGYSIEMFESPSKFKDDGDLSNMIHIKQKNRSIKVEPFFRGDENPVITRCDFEIEHKFNSTCIFMGSLMTDKQGNFIGKNCKCDTNIGKLSDLTPFEGEIEMIRKRPDGGVEEFVVQGNKLIDGDGVWCYQIPMNLDYIITDEFGNIVHTDNPNKGIATRADVRFRFTVEDAIEGQKNSVRARYLVPHNPGENDNEIDFEFGSKTKDSSFRSLFYNNVYTVKSYIPNLRRESGDIVGKAISKIDKTTTRHVGIKYTNIPGDNNPFPYTYLNINLGFTYRFLCTLIDIIKEFIGVINLVFSSLALPFCYIAKLLQDGLCITIFGAKICPLYKLGEPFRVIAEALSCIPLKRGFCDDGVNPRTYYYGCFKDKCIMDNTRKKHIERELKNGESPSEPVFGYHEGFMDCIKMRLSETNETMSYNFINDWINGTLYFPLWYREIKRKRSFFGIFGKKKIQDNYCNADRSKKSVFTYSFENLFTSKSYNLKKIGMCAVGRKDDLVIPNNANCGDTCNDLEAFVSIDRGIIKEFINSKNKKVYYYNPSEKTNQGYVKLFATDIVLLSPLYDCNGIGLPPIMHLYEQTTYKLPYPILFSETNLEYRDGSLIHHGTEIEHAGASYTVDNNQLCNKSDSGLFYDLTCLRGYLEPKSCVNLKRICELDVALDEVRFVPNINKLNSNPNDSFDRLMIDGYISNDEITSHTGRSIFAMLNNNSLRTRYNKKTGLYEYDIDYMYIDNFDGSLYERMKSSQGRKCGNTSKNNYILERRNEDYVRFIYGDTPESYQREFSFPKTRNSFYFYFGLKEGKTALNKYNKYFRQECNSNVDLDIPVEVYIQPNSWCNNINEGDRDGYVAFNFEYVNKPLNLDLINLTNKEKITFKGIQDDKVILSNHTIEQFKNDGYVGLNGGMIYNGDWTYEVTNNEGVFITGKINFSSDILNFEVTGYDFKMSRELITTKYNSYSDISNDKNGLNLNERSIGGTIFISEIKNAKGEYITNYKLEVNALNSNGFVDYDVDYSPLMISNGTVVGDGFLKQYNNGVLVGLPIPNETYTIRVVELCNGVETSNSFTQTIYIGEYKTPVLYINGINSNLFSRFRHEGDYYGWDRLMNFPQYEPLTLANADINKVRLLKEKLSLSDDGVSPYNWVEEYTLKLKREDLNLIESYDTLEDSEKEYVLDLINNVIEKRKEVEDTILSTFLIYNQDNSNVSLSSDYGIKPHTIRYVASDYVYNSDHDENVFSKIKKKEEGYIFNPMLPTLTYKNGKYVPFVDATGVRATPNFVAMMDKAGDSVPKNISSDEFRLYNTNKFLGLHFIDKRSIIEHDTWLPIMDVPYYKPTDKNLEGKLLTKPGLSTITMDNFKSDGVNDEGYSIFKDFTINGNSVNVKTTTLNPDGTPNEYATPTKRIVLNKDSNINDYPNYTLNGLNNGYFTFYDNLNISLRDSLGNRENIDLNGDVPYEVYNNMRKPMTPGEANDNRYSRYEMNLKLDISDPVDIYVYEYNGRNYLPYNIDNINNYDSYGVMKRGDHFANSGYVKKISFNDIPEKITLYDNNHDSVNNKRIFFILHNKQDNTKKWSHIIDMQKILVNKKLKEDTQELTIEIVNYVDLYYLKEYEFILNVKTETGLLEYKIPPLKKNTFSVKLGSDYSYVKDNLSSSVMNIIDITRTKYLI